MKKSLWIFGGISLLFITCKHEMIDASVSQTPVPIVNPTSDSVCFTAEVLPLFQSYCGSKGCHGSGSAEEGVSLETYFNIMKGISPGNPNNSKYFREITKGSMPPKNSPQLSSAQVAVLQKWINQGAKNTTCVSACDTSKFTYTNAIQSLLATNCNGCHGSMPGSGGVYLGTLTAAQNYINANKALFLNAINHSATLPAPQRMPPAAKMSDCQVQQLTKWINANMPN
ncbi:MAG: cytochrome c [Chitinophagaceae bacterium]|nr:cytochrome c [Chitinophagaceae bacterium]